MEFKDFLSGSISNEVRPAVFLPYTCVLDSSCQSCGVGLRALLNPLVQAGFIFRGRIIERLVLEGEIPVVHLALLILLLKGFVPLVELGELSCL